MPHPHRPRPASQNLSPRVPVTEPSLSVVFLTASYPTLRLDESESDMITRAAVDTLKVPREAVMAAPAPSYLGQGDNEESLFEVHLRQGFATVAELKARAAVLNVTPKGKASARELSMPKRHLRLPRGK